MKLWKISQDVNNGYDTYDSAIVAAISRQKARLIHPAGYETWPPSAGTWVVDPAQVKVEYVGVAARGTKPGVVIASFNAG
jgi:hypothetical protein